MDVDIGGSPTKVPAAVVFAEDEQFSPTSPTPATRGRGDTSCNTNREDNECETKSSDVKVELTDKVVPVSAAAAVPVTTASDASEMRSSPSKELENGDHSDKTVQKFAIDVSPNVEPEVRPN